jgi:hypothetical protein
MGMVNVSSGDKPIESTNLEAHVALCAQRHKSLEGKLNEILEQNKAHKRMIFAAALSFVTGGLSGVFALLLHLAGRLL